MNNIFTESDLRPDDLHTIASYNGTKVPTSLCKTEFQGWVDQNYHHDRIFIMARFHVHITLLKIKKSRE
jgi:hypothetical protein